MQDGEIEMGTYGRVEDADGVRLVKRNTTLVRAGQRPARCLGSSPLAFCRAWAAQPSWRLGSPCSGSLWRTTGLEPPSVGTRSRSPCAPLLLPRSARSSSLRRTGSGSSCSAFYLSPWPIAVAVTAGIAGRMSDRIPTAQLCAFGAGLLAALLFGTLFISAAAGHEFSVWDQAGLTAVATAVVQLLRRKPITEVTGALNGRVLRDVAVGLVAGFVLMAVPACLLWLSDIVRLDLASADLRSCLTATVMEGRMTAVGNEREAFLVDLETMRLAALGLE